MKSIDSLFIFDIIPISNEELTMNKYDEDYESTNEEFEAMMAARQAEEDELQAFKNEFNL